MTWQSSKRPPKPKRRRVSQEDIDAMAELRRQGLAFAEIGVRQGFSERTARRYVGKVEPHLILPHGDSEPESDLATLRERLTREFLEILYRDKKLNALTMTWQSRGPDLQEAVYGGPPSVLFLSEAERLIRERLDSMGILAVRFLARDGRLQRRFLREVVGPLYLDYVGWHEFSQSFGETGEGWRPPRECPRVEVEE